MTSHGGRDGPRDHLPRTPPSSISRPASTPSSPTARPAFLTIKPWIYVTRGVSRSVYPLLQQGVFLWFSFLCVCFWRYPWPCSGVKSWVRRSLTDANLEEQRLTSMLDSAFWFLLSIKGQALSCMIAWPLQSACSCLSEWLSTSTLIYVFFLLSFLYLHRIVYSCGHLSERLSLCVATLLHNYLCRSLSTGKMFECL